MGAALWSWFLVGSEGNVRHWGPLPAGAFRPSGPWCFAVSESPARTVLRAWEQTARQAGRQTGWQGGRQGGRQTDRQAGTGGRQADRQTDRQAGRQADSYFAVDRQAGRQTDRQPSARSSLRSCFESVGAALWSWFLVGSEGNVRHWGPLPAGAFRPSGP